MIYHNRVIPCLLLQNHGLVKTIKFGNPQYIGDPLNAVRIFNDKEVDELIFLDITATREKRKPDFEYLRLIANQCFMPLCYGGGLTEIEDIKKVFSIGFEKVAICSSAYKNEKLITEAADRYGSQSIVAVIDIKRGLSGKSHAYIENGKRKVKKNIVEYAKRLELLGAGELLVNNIDEDGMMHGYNLNLIRTVSDQVNIPVIACGGAGTLDDMVDVVKVGKASAAAAGSLFVYWGINRGILINYPQQEEIKKKFGEKCDGISNL